LCAVSGVRTGPPGIAFLDEAARRLFGMSVGRATDDPRVTHADVLRAYDVAITLGEADVPGRLRVAS
jgi:hypothetical protein